MPQRFDRRLQGGFLAGKEAVGNDAGEILLGLWR